MRKWITVGVVALVWVGSARAEVKLFAKYDWQDGAKDVAGAAIRHDGVLAPGASIVDGKLVVDRWDGVTLGKIPELNGAKEALFRFEDVTFDRFGDLGSQRSSSYAVFLGDGMKWWAAAYFTFLPESELGLKTRLVFNIGGFRGGAVLTAEVADEVVTHFDSIEYRLNGNAPVNERFAIRWNDGPWVVGGTGGDWANSIPVTELVRINNGASADWDPMWGSMGTVSLSSNVVAPEPGVWAMVGVVGMGLSARRRQDRRSDKRQRPQSI